MSVKSFTPLGLHRTDCRYPAAGDDWASRASVREQLLTEIGALDKQLEALRSLDGCPDFSLQQTCLEMIHSRQVLFRRLRGS